MNREMNSVLLKSIGASANNEKVIDEQGMVNKLANWEDERIKIIRSRSGGHFSFIKYSNIVNQTIMDLLKQVSEDEGAKIAQMK